MTLGSNDKHYKHYISVSDFIKGSS
jgi:hypothetical protein